MLMSRWHDVGMGECGEGLIWGFAMFSCHASRPFKNSYLR